ncbi:MAG: hypothetical protein R3E96_00660 [Planctomycetota bacterium]
MTPTQVLGEERQGGSGGLLCEPGLQQLLGDLVRREADVSHPLVLRPHLQLDLARAPGEYGGAQIVGEGLQVGDQAPGGGVHDPIVAAAST